MIVLGIDPGMYHLGWSVLEVDTQQNTMTVKAVGQIEADKSAKKKYKNRFIDNRQILTILELESQLSEVVERYQPDRVVSESAFMARFPHAYVSLSMCILSIRRVLFDYNRTLSTIAPKEAKKAVAIGTADKRLVSDSIHRISDLKLPDTELTEHEADSIAIAYAFVKNKVFNKK